jgi:excisionase family DNA binding protein
MTTRTPSRADTELLTTQDVAARLRVGLDDVRRWIRSGALPAVALGGRRMGYRVSESALAQFVKAREAGR